MNKPTRSVELIVWGGLALVMAVIFGAYFSARLRAARHPLPVLATVSDFALTNQFGRSVTLEDLRGKVWIADIIFTRCPGPCAKMTKQMSELQAALPSNEPVQLVSLTADPEFDTPEVLKKYGERFGALPQRWQFLTGKKLDVYRLATKGLLLAVDEIKADERTSPDDLFVHSTLFVIVDKHGRVRGSFDGTEASSRSKILAAMRALLKEKQP
ncbi:MAG TPA: SCO family protein [Candidatus Angelobacter sp.]|nr:SCO family protein [Candidatus Angelobacter sp.]